MNLLFDDVVRLGQVMDVAAQAEDLVAGWKDQLSAIEAKTADQPRPRVFLLDGPADAPFTAGKFAIPDAMITAAGGGKRHRRSGYQLGPAPRGKLLRLQTRNSLFCWIIKPGMVPRIHSNFCRTIRSWREQTR